MKGLSFQVQQAVAAATPQRLDIACFVGCVDVRDDAPRDDVHQWLYRQGWLNSADGLAATYHRDSARDLLDVPVPIDSWQRFDQLFAWEQRAYTDTVAGSGYLAAAVRSFFAQGGRQCYVVRVAGNLDYRADAAQRLALVSLMLPGFPAVNNSSAQDRSSWHGVAHLFGLPEVAMVCLPDLPELFATAVGELEMTAPDRDPGTEQFAICQPGETLARADTAREQIPAPTCDDAGYAEWSRSINWLARFLAESKRDAQLIAALPLPDGATEAARNPLAYMHRQAWLSGSINSNEHCLASAFVQLVYPWLRTSDSQVLAQGIEPPDAVFSGVLARNALRRGVYRTVSGLTLQGVTAVYPSLSRQQQFAAHDEADPADTPTAALIDRMSLLGPAAQDIAVLSDVTTSALAAHRPASINRVIGLLVRSARQAGEEFVFESNGEALWAQVAQRFNDLLRQLFDLGALRGREPTDAYFVRCDRSTMTQQDIDQGRLIVQLQFDPAAAVESIDVVLAMQPTGSVDLSTIGVARAVA